MSGNMNNSLFLYTFLYVYPFSIKSSTFAEYNDNFVGFMMARFYMLLTNFTMTELDWENCLAEKQMG